MIFTSTTELLNKLKVLPKTENLQIQSSSCGIVLTAISEDEAIQTALECPISSEVNLCLPLGVLTQWLKLCPKAASLTLAQKVEPETDRQFAEIKVGTSKLCLHSIETELAIPSFEPQHEMWVNLPELQAVLKKALNFTTDKFHPRHELSGVRIRSAKGKTQVIATDGHRLHVASLKDFSTENFAYTLSKPFIKSLLKLKGEKARLLFCPFATAIDLGQTRLIGKTEGIDFPPVTKYVRALEQFIEVDRLELIKSTERVSSNKTGNLNDSIVTLRASQGRIVVDGSLGSEGFYAYTGLLGNSCHGARVNRDYLISILKSLSGKVAQIELGEMDKFESVQITAESEALNVVMPIMMRGDEEKLQPLLDNPEQTTSLEPESKPESIPTTVKPEKKIIDTEPQVKPEYQTAEIKAQNWQSMTLVELKAFCKAHDLAGYSRMKKAEIIRMLENFSVPTPQTDHSPNFEPVPDPWLTQPLSSPLACPVENSIHPVLSLAPAAEPVEPVKSFIPSCPIPVVIPEPEREPEPVTVATNSPHPIPLPAIALFAMGYALAYLGSVLLVGSFWLGSMILGCITWLLDNRDLAAEATKTASIDFGLCAVRIAGYWLSRAENWLLGQKYRQPIKDHLGATVDTNQKELTHANF